MLLIPAIDLQDGRCVRLRQGDLDDATIFSEDPSAMATQWLDQGARRLHLVDLNGAVAGKPKNEAAIKSIIKARSEEHTYELQSLMRISYAVFCLKKKNTKQNEAKIQLNNTSKK